MSQQKLMLNTLFGNLKPGEFNTFFLITNYARTNTPIASYYCLKIFPRYFELIQEKKGTESNHKLINGSWQKNGANVSDELATDLIKLASQIGDDITNKKTKVFQKQSIAQSMARASGTGLMGSSSPSNLSGEGMQETDNEFNNFNDLSYGNNSFGELSYEELDGVSGGVSDPLAEDMGISIDQINPTDPVLIDLGAKKIISTAETFKFASEDQTNLIAKSLKNLVSL